MTNSSKLMFPAAPFLLLTALFTMLAPVTTGASPPEVFLQERLGSAQERLGSAPVPGPVKDGDNGAYALRTLLGAPYLRGDLWTPKSQSPETGGFGEAAVGTCEHIYLAKCDDMYDPPHFWRYNPDYDTWSTMSTSGLYSGIFRNGTALAWGDGDNIYALCGARYSDTDRRLFYRYDISANSWSRLEDSPAKQGAGDAITWSGYDGYFYALLGSNSHGTVFARYDPDTDVWTTRQSPPEGTDDGCSIVWGGNRHLFALRGEYSESYPYTDFWRYDIDADRWYTKEDLPDSGGISDGGSLLWMGQCLSGYEDHIFALGGSTCYEDPGYGFYHYSIAVNDWTTLSDLPYPVGYYNGCRIGFADDHVYFWQGSPPEFAGGGDRFYMYCWDNDQDGFADETCGGEDCDDDVATANPNMQEDCGPSGSGNGIDDNCNGTVDEGCGPCFVASVF